MRGRNQRWRLHFITFEREIYCQRTRRYQRVAWQFVKRHRSVRGYGVVWRTIEKEKK